MFKPVYVLFNPWCEGKCVQITISGNCPRSSTNERLSIILWFGSTIGRIVSTHAFMLPVMINCFGSVIVKCVFACVHACMHAYVLVYHVRCRGAVVNGVEHISTNLKVNIRVARVRVQLVLSVGI